MQMLMKSNRSNAQRGSVLRLTACVSLAAVAVLTAGMLQVQPALAGERVAQQNAPATPQPAQAAQSSAQDREPRLLSGEHARQQLQHAQGQLAAAERQATTDEDRRKIATARDMMIAAEGALASAGASRSGGADAHVDLSKLQVQLDAMKLPDMDEIRAKVDSQREAMDRVRAQMDSSEWRARMEKTQRDAVAKVQAQMVSPEFRAQMEKTQREDLARMQAQMKSPVWRAQMEKSQHDAMARVQAQMDSAEFRQRIQTAVTLGHEEAARAAKRLNDESRQMAMLDMPQSPVAVQQPKLAKIASGVMAGNILHQETPVYPADAKEKKIQGEVLLHAIINERGTVEQLAVVSSPDASLSKSAIAAVSHWTYKPYLLNGDPTAVDTTISVHYSLAP